MNYEKLKAEAAVCTACDLHKGRENPVFDKGNSSSKFMICGMVPAVEENKAGLPFVGRAGKLLDEILDDAGLDLDSVYITNLVKCFLKAGEKLKQEWIDACLPYLLVQMQLIEPKVIVALGGDASNALVSPNEKTPMYKLRNKVHNYGNIKVVATYHPSYILRKGGKNSGEYQKVLDDFNIAKGEY